MSVADVSTLLKELQSNVDELRDLLKPLLGGVGEVSAKLPLLDQAKLNVLTCYAIESLLFSESTALYAHQNPADRDIDAMRLNGVEVQNHSIYTELKRVRQYFDKIKAIENPPAPREGTVNMVPAMRILRNDLARGRSHRFCRAGC